MCTVSDNLSEREDAVFERLQLQQLYIDKLEEQVQCLREALSTQKQLTEVFRNRVVELEGRISHIRGRQ